LAQDEQLSLVEGIVSGREGLFTLSENGRIRLKKPGQPLQCQANTLF